MKLFIHTHLRFYAFFCVLSSFCITIQLGEKKKRMKSTIHIESGYFAGSWECEWRMLLPYPMHAHIHNLQSFVGLPYMKLIHKFMLQQQNERTNAMKNVCQSLSPDHLLNSFLLLLSVFLLLFLLVLVLALVLLLLLLFV